MPDLKDLNMTKAQELADSLYSKDFYDLSIGLQDVVYLKAEDMVVDDLASAADAIHEAQKDKYIGVAYKCESDPEDVCTLLHEADSTNEEE